MKHTHAMVRVRMYMGEADTYSGRPKHEYILDYLRKEGYLGATVFRGLLGFGSHGTLRSANILDLSTDLPMVVEVVDNERNVERLVSELEKSEFGHKVFITYEPVTALQFS